MFPRWSLLSLFTLVSDDPSLSVVMFAMVRAHWIDIGGMSTGFGAGPTVADPWMEGLQLDQLKIYEEGKRNETLYKVIRDNIRTLIETNLERYEASRARAPEDRASVNTCSGSTRRLGAGTLRTGLAAIAPCRNAIAGICFSTTLALRACDGFACASHVATSRRSLAK